MNKKSSKIILFCILCSVIVLLLFLLVIRLTQPSCELIFIDVESHKRQALNSMDKTKPIRSRDKTFIIRMSAHLEYFKTDAEFASNSVPLAPTPTNQHAPAVLTNAPYVRQWNNTASATPTNQAIGQVQPNNNNNNSTNHNYFNNNNNNNTQSYKHPTPSAPQYGFNLSMSNQQQQQQQMQNNRRDYNSGGWTTNQLNSSNSINNNNNNNTNLNQVRINQHNQSLTNQQQHQQIKLSGEKRFLPLELRANDHVELKELGNLRYKFKLNFDCAEMSLIIVRRPERVHVEQINIELREPNKHKSSCQIRFPQGAFGVDTRDWRAHYYCDKLPKYSCNHFSSKHPNHAPLLLADLQIHYLEFEVSTNHTAIHKSHQFASPKSEYNII